MYCHLALLRTKQHKLTVFLDPVSALSISPQSEADAKRPHGYPVHNRFPGRSAADKGIILPKYVYIRNEKGRYLCYNRGDIMQLALVRSGKPDPDCVIQAVKTGTSRYRFLVHGNLDFTRFKSFRSDDELFYGVREIPASRERPSFDLILTSEEKVYLKDNFSPSYFLYSASDNDYTAAMGRGDIVAGSQMEIMAAAITNEIGDVEYDLPGAKVHDATPIVALNTSVRNDSDGSVNQTLSYSYEKWTVGTWNNTAGVEIGAKWTFSAGVPVVANSKFEISVSASYSHSWGGENGTRQTISSSTTVTVPPRKKARASIIIRNAQIDVDFTYTQKILWSNGQSEEEKKTGIYNNVDSWNVDVVMEDLEDV